MVWRGAVLKTKAGTFFLNIVREQLQVFIWVSMLSSDIKSNPYLADVHIGKGDDLKGTTTVRHLNLNTIQWDTRGNV